MPQGVGNPRKEQKANKTEERGKGEIFMSSGDHESVES